MRIWKKIKYIVVTIGTLIVSIWLASGAYRRGQKSGEKKIRKEIENAENERKIKQQKINTIHNNAIREAMDINRDNVVDRFNGMFHASDDDPAEH